MNEQLTLMTLADEIEKAISPIDITDRINNMNNVLRKVRSSIQSLGYAYGFAEDSVSKIISMQNTDICKNKLMFNEDIELAKKIISICRSIFNREP